VLLGTRTVPRLIYRFLVVLRLGAEDGCAVTDAVREAESIVAGEVSVRASVVRSVSGGEIEIEQSAVQQAHGDEVEVEQSAVLQLSGTHVDVDDSVVGAVIARKVEARNVRTVFLVASQFKGDVRTVFDWKSAVAIGVGIVLTRRLLKLLRLW
jgi:hypothetical protein